MDLVFDFSNMISPELCKKMIIKFDNEPRVKKYQSEDCLHISQFLEWDEIMDELKPKLEEFIEMFKKHWYSKWPGETPENSSIYSYNLKNGETLVIRKLNTGGVWECPFHVEGNLERFCAFYICLSDEGETDFIHKKIKSKIGKLVMFPATWHDVYSHINCEGRYMLTGFFHRALPTC
jgi:hypothetical protein